MDLLTFLAGWYASCQRSERSDLEVRFGRSAEDVAMQSAWIDFKGAARSGQLTIWESGDAELEVNDISTLDLVFWRLDKVQSTEHLEELIAILVEQVLNGGS